VGPFQSGKTTLLEAILARMGAVQRQGVVSAGTTVGDASAEARAHAMSVEANIASVDFMGDTYTFIDCPGSVEFLPEMRGVLPAIDAAVVVCEADEKKVRPCSWSCASWRSARSRASCSSTRSTTAIRACATRCPCCSRPLACRCCCRQIPIWKDGIAVGYIDLALERAFIYQEHAASRVVEIPPDERDTRRKRASPCWSGCPTMTTG